MAAKKNIPPKTKKTSSPLSGVTRSQNKEKALENTRGVKKVKKILILIAIMAVAFTLLEYDWRFARKKTVKERYFYTQCMASNPVVPPPHFRKWCRCLDNALYQVMAEEEVKQLLSLPPDQKEAFLTPYLNSRDAKGMQKRVWSCLRHWPAFHLWLKDKGFRRKILETIKTIKTINGAQ